jgi:hypothetical protein
MIGLVSTLSKSEPVRIELLSLKGEPSTVAMRPDVHYWPTFILNYSNEKGWQRTDVVSD